MHGPFITIFVGDSGGFVAHVTVSVFDTYFD